MSKERMLQLNYLSSVVCLPSVHSYVMNLQLCVLLSCITTRALPEGLASSLADIEIQLYCKAEAGLLLFVWTGRGLGELKCQAVFN